MNTQCEIHQITHQERPRTKHICARCVILQLFSWSFLAQDRPGPQPNANPNGIDAWSGVSAVGV